MKRTAGARAWLTTSWVPAAMMAGVCLVVAGAWPVVAPPPAPLPPPVSWSAAASPPGLPAPSDTAGRSVRPPATEPAPASSPPAGGAPSGLVIESVGIVAPVDRVGTHDGEVVIPDDPGRVGLWTGGADPGDPAGVVLVTGHVSWNNTRGALWALAATAVGDVVVLSEGPDATTRWRVTEVEVLPRDADHPHLFDRGGTHRLAVVTCAGPVTDDGYRDLVVVHAEPQA